jgi:hypothetical protein
MTRKFNYLFAVIASFTLLIASCKKGADNNNTTDPNETELTTQSDDQAQFTNDADDLSNDVNAAFDGVTAINGRIFGVVCGATVTLDTMSNPRKVTITYNGFSCDSSRKRVGTVVASIPAGVRWKDAGAVITVTITNLKITRVRDNKSITINGTKTITNVTGGLLRHLATISPIVHTISSNNMSITFDNNTQRTWNIAKRRTFTYNNGIVIRTAGTHGPNNNIVEWGTNRFGNAFITIISDPLTVRQDCNFRLVSGQVRHELLGRNTTTTFGLNAQGNPTTCPGNNPYYLKIVWTLPNNNTHTVIRPY